MKSVVWRLYNPRSNFPDDRFARHQKVSLGGGFLLCIFFPTIGRNPSEPHPCALCLSLTYVLPKRRVGSGETRGGRLERVGMRQIHRRHQLEQPRPRSALTLRRSIAATCTGPSTESGPESCAPIPSNPLIGRADNAR